MTSPGRRGVPGSRALAGLGGLIGLGVVLELVPRLGLIRPAYLPPTSTILNALVHQAIGGEFWLAVAETMEAWAIGLMLAFLAAVFVGTLIGMVPFLRRGTASTIEFLRPIPSVALIPLAVLLYATDIRSTLLLVVYASFWPVLVQVLYGVADVDPVALDTARSYRLGFGARLVYLIWPGALPYVLTGLRLAAAVALILAITAELVIGNPGLGHLIETARSSGAVPQMYALVVATGLIGVGVNVLVRLLERAMLFWHPSIRAEVEA